MVYFVLLRPNPAAMFEKSGLLDIVGRDHILDGLTEAITMVERDMAKKQHAGRLTPIDEP